MTAANENISTSRGFFKLTTEKKQKSTGSTVNSASSGWKPFQPAASDSEDDDWSWASEDSEEDHEGVSLALFSMIYTYIY